MAKIDHSKKTETTSGQNSKLHLPGNAADLEFAEFVRSALHCPRVKILHILNEDIHGKNIINIIGTRRNLRCRRLEKLALIYCILGIVLIVVATLIRYNHSLTVSLFRPLIITGIIISTGCLFSIILSELLNVENVLTLCINLETKVEIEDAKVLLTKIIAYKENGNPRFNYSEFVLVSYSGYAETALDFLVKNKVDCYEKKDGKIVKKDRSLNFTYQVFSL